MDNLPNSNLRKQVDNLANVMALWETVLEEIREMQKTIEKLPTSPKSMQQELDSLNQPNSPLLPSQSQKAIPPLPKTGNLQPYQSELQDSLVHLRAVLPQLSVLELKVGNLVALKERVEALQENLQSASASKPVRRPKPIQLQEVRESPQEVQTPKALAQLELHRPPINNNPASQRNLLAKPIQAKLSKRSWRLGTLIVGILVGCGLIYWAIPLLNGDRLDNNKDNVETRL